MKPTIHFSHANGFPAGCYHALFAALRPDFDIGFLDRIGHNPHYPITDGWPHLVAETIHTIQQTYQQPVIGVGHSLGGYLTLMAALQRPDLFSKVVIVDSPLMPPWRGRSLWLAKKLGWIDKLTPGRYTLNRRDYWPSVDEAQRFFASKSVFAKFHPQVLRDYACYGTEEHQQGRRLFFRPQVEYQIYRTLPHALYRERNRLTIPGLFIAAKGSNVVKPYFLPWLQHKFGLDIVQVEGSHLFPLEDPDLAAQVLKNWLS